MTGAERFHCTEHWFHELYGRSEAERTAAMEGALREDASVVRAVFALLESSLAEHRLCDSYGTGAAQPTRIGVYELERVLGRGGMGEVWLARRADGQFAQQVAIKLIGPRLDQAEFSERFRQERQILAGLHHAHIARLLDGGLSETGQPYYVMEYVAGVPADRFCEERNLPLRARLKLFLDICAGVDHAHRCLVVHRDLKPDNILVDAGGNPKLLDFGMARIVTPAGEGADVTRPEQRAFTPAYASPEQVLGHPVTVSTDIYSLGVILYRLLTGRSPYDTGGGSVGELLRTVVEGVPRPPSEAAPAQRSALHGDLDAMVMKAMRKEPHARYRTVEALAADLTAWLEGRPVAARQGDFRYKAGKFLRRHRAGAAAAVIVTLTLAAGVAGVAWQGAVAMRERARAEERYGELRRLSSSLLFELYDAVKPLPGSTEAQRTLVTRAVGLLDRLSKETGGGVTLDLELVDGWIKLANVQGNPYEDNLGDPAGARASAAKAIALARTLSLTPAGAAEAPLALARARRSLGEILLGEGKHAEAAVEMRGAAEELAVRAASGTPAPGLLYQTAVSWEVLGDLANQAGSKAAGYAPEQCYEKAVAYNRQALEASPQDARIRRGRVVLLMKMGDGEAETKPAAAVRRYQEALAAFQALPPADRAQVGNRRLEGFLHRKQGFAHLQADDPAAALEATRRALAVCEPLASLAIDDARAQWDLAVTLHQISLTFEARSDAPGASPYLERLEKTLAGLTAKQPGNNLWQIHLANTRLRLGAAYLAQGKRVEGRALALAGVAKLKEATAQPGVSPAQLDEAAQQFLAVEPAPLRDPAAALALARSAVEQTGRKEAAYLLTLARVLKAVNQAEEGRAAAREGLTLVPDATPKPRVRRLLEAEAR
jgi:non-specific serine/threonine protein kinase/serine/threonine-protein kinase